MSEPTQEELIAELRADVAALLALVVQHWRDKWSLHLPLSGGSTGFYATREEAEAAAVVEGRRRLKGGV